MNKIFVCIFLFCATVEVRVYSGVAATGLKTSEKMGVYIAEIFRKFGPEGEELAKIVKVKYSDEAVESLQTIVKVIPLNNVGVLKTLMESLSEAQLKVLANLIEKYPDLLEIVGNPGHLKFIGKYFIHTEALYRVAKTWPGHQTVQMFENIAQMRGGDEILGVFKHWGTEKMPGTPDDLLHLKRLLDGKTYSSKAVLNVMNGFKRAVGEGVLTPSHWGDFVEDMAKTAIEAGRMEAGVKKGSKLIRGQHSGRAGIDLIGVAEDGRPVILEVGGWKNFADKGLTDASGMVEMSPAWIADRWNKIFNVADPAKLKELVEQYSKMGIDIKYLPPNKVTKEMVESNFIRKVVVPDTTQVKNLAAIGLDGTKNIVTF